MNSININNYKNYLNKSLNIDQQANFWKLKHAV